MFATKLFEPCASILQIICGSPGEFGFGCYLADTFIGASS